MKKKITETSYNECKDPFLKLLLKITDNTHKEKSSHLQKMRIRCQSEFFLE